MNLLVFIDKFIDLVQSTGLPSKPSEVSVAREIGDLVCEALEREILIDEAVLLCQGYSEECLDMTKRINQTEASQFRCECL
jgi:hypothetical protein